MEGTDLAILSAVALATSVLSAVVGMAGGITLLSVMLLFLEPLAAIPLHGVIQLVSNSSRAVIQRRHRVLRPRVGDGDGRILIQLGQQFMQIGTP